MLVIAAMMVLVQAQVPGPVDAFLRASGYERKERSSMDARYSNAARRSSISWLSQRLPSPSHGNRLIDSYDRMSAYRPRNAVDLPPPSGIPLGKHLRYHPGSQSVLFRAASDSHFVNAHMTIGAQWTRGGAPDFVPTFPSEKEMLEAVTRWVLGTRSAEGMMRTSWVHYNQSFPALRSGAGRLHVPARTFAQRRNMGFNWNESAGRLSISSPRGQVLLALGAPSVKVGSEWIPIGDVVVADGVEIMLPVEIVSRIDP